MFMVTFRDAATERNLTQPRLLPEVPAKGESVFIRQKADSWRHKKGTVTSRVWYIVDDEADSSEVVVLISVEAAK